MDNYQYGDVFYQIFKRLCVYRSVCLTTALDDMKISRSTLFNWKRGGLPQDDTVRRIEQYFDIGEETLLNLVRQLKNEHNRNYFMTNWESYLKSMFPNVEPDEDGANDMIVLSKEEISDLQRYIENIKEILENIEKIIYKNKKK